MTVQGHKATRGCDERSPESAPLPPALTTKSPQRDACDFISILSAGGGENQCLLNEKEKDRQEENVFSTFNRVLSTVTSQK